MNRLEGSRVQEEVRQSVREKVDERVAVRMSTKVWQRGCAMEKEVLECTRYKIRDLVLSTLDERVRR